MSNREESIESARLIGQGPTNMRYVALAALSSTAILAYFSRNAVGVAESTIRAEFALTPRESGWMMGVFFWSYASLGIPMGWLGYKFGTRGVLALCLVAWSAATALMGIAGVFPVLLAAQLLMGAAQAGVLPCTVKSVADWMPTTRRAFSCGSLGAGMQVGAILSAYLTGWLLQRIAWREVFLLYSLPGILGAIAFYAMFRNHPAQARRVNEAELALIRGDAGDGSLTNARLAKTPWGDFICSRTVWFISLQQVFRAAGYMFFASWLPSFLQKTRGVSIEDSGKMQALVFVAALTGSLLGGVFVDWVYRKTNSKTISRVAVGSSCMMLCGLLVLGSFFVGNAMIAIALMSLGLFLAAIGGPCALAAVIDVSGEHVPEVTAIMNSAGNFAVAICPVVVGKFFEATNNWNLVLWGFAAVYIAAGACWPFVDVKKPIYTRAAPPPSA